MTSRSPTPYQSKNGILHRREWGEVQVSTNDTITLSGFVDNQNLLHATVIKKDGGAELTNTVANNVVTVTGTATNADCIYLAYGYKA